MVRTGRRKAPLFEAAEPEHQFVPREAAPNGQMRVLELSLRIKPNLKGSSKTAL